MDNKRILNKQSQPMYISYKIGNDRVFYDLYEASEYDKRQFTPKNGCKLFRLNSPEHKSWPIVSINLSNNRIYFLKDFDDDNSGWGTTGIKLDFDLNTAMNK